MRKIYKNIFPVFLLLAVSFFADAQQKDLQSLNKEVVQLYGVISTENNVPLPQASIFVEGSPRGTLTNNKGIYSIVVSKGDKVRFSFIGFKDVIVSIPKTIVSSTYNVDYKMVEDTTVLPTTFVKALPSAAQFDRDFLEARADITSFDLAQYNVRKELLLSMAAFVPKDGSEAVSSQSISQIPGMIHTGRGTQTVNFLRPSTWSGFVKEWKEGGSVRN